MKPHDARSIRSDVGVRKPDKDSMLPALEIEVGNGMNIARILILLAGSPEVHLRDISIIGTQVYTEISLRGVRSLV